MSVSVHEAFCLDSPQDRYWFIDHFLGDQIQDEWTLTVAGGGTGVVVDQQTGGIVRLSAPTNATADSAYLHWNNIRSLLVTKKVSWESRFKINSTTQISIFNGLRVDGGNIVRFTYDRAAVAANWGMTCGDGGAFSNIDSGIAADTDYHIFRLECHTHGGSHVHFYIDGTETANSPHSTNIPDDATDYLMPRFYLDTNDTNLKQLDIDYVAIRQDR